MNFRIYARGAGFLFLGLSILFLDFFTKAYVYNILPFYDSYAGLPSGEIEVFRNFLGIDFFIALTTNSGAAWGMFADFKSILLVVRILVILGLLVYLFFLNKSRSADLPLVFIISGALGNVIDFFLYGHVIDFLHFNLWGYHFPVFNVADSSITIGSVLFFVTALFFKKNRSVEV
ncbi:MAG: signal peptidase II [Chlamydiales bacterium]